VRALAAYDLEPARVEFLAHSENTTFRVTAADGSRYLLRVHRPHRHGRDADPAAAIRSELEWLEELNATTALPVPAPVRSIAGELTTTVASDEVDGPRVCSLLRWMNGRNRSRSPRPVHLQRLGGVLAQLHDHADQWSLPDQFMRLRWDHAAYFGNTMVYGNVDAADAWQLVPTALRRQFARVADEVGAVMRTLGEGPSVFGLIHADAHLDNVIFDGSHAGLIDFDDCGFGYRMYDVAVALWQLRHRADYPAFHSAFVEGYTRQRPLPAEQLAHLDIFIAAREVAFGLWLVGMAETRDSFRADLAAELGYVERGLDVVLNGPN
jgi:Ser/Thr protein kinase RdoA (MazF antagonist)